MYVLNTTGKSIEVLLAGAVTTNQLVIVSSYMDVTATAATIPGANDLLTSDTTAVTAVAAPGASTSRLIKHLSIFNADTASATVTVRLNNSSTYRTLVKITLEASSFMETSDFVRWSVVRSDGSTPSTTGATGPAGDTGAAGVGLPGMDGVDGEDGMPGPPGRDGANGADGADGSPGATGPAGASAPGLPGMDGDDGADSFVPGPPGPTGATGATGSAGASMPGLPGMDGEDGADGMPGPPGAAGATGSAGAAGTPGPMGFNGEDGESGFVLLQPSGGFGGYIVLQDQKSSASAGGTFTSGAWQTRTLNTEVIDTGNNCSLSSNQFTLDAGTYEITASAPGYFCSDHQIRLQNITDSTTTSTGTSEYSTNGVADTSQTRSFLVDRFTITAAKAFEIQHRCAVTRATNGFGVAFGVTTEVYTLVLLRKVA